MKRALSFICACAILALTACQPKEVAVTSVTVSPSTLELTEGDAAVSLTAKVLPENAIATVSWTSSDNSVASVSSNGSVTPLKEGSTTITATADGKSGSCKVTVASKVIPVTSITLDKTELKLAKGGEAYQMHATVNPENATDPTITWESSDESKVMVSKSGLVTPVNVGTSTITAKAGDKSATCKVTVFSEDIAVTGVSLDVTSATLRLGSVDNTLQLKATVAPSDATNQNLNWSSSVPEIATVSETGLVTAKAVGNTTITVTTADGGKIATCTITVAHTAITGINIVGATAERKEVLSNQDKIIKLEAEVLPVDASNKNVTWKSSNSSIGYITKNSDGEYVLGLSSSYSGDFTITATSDENPSMTAKQDYHLKVIASKVAFNSNEAVILVGETKNLQQLSLLPERILSSYGHLKTQP